mgnify:CR=1 FL=1
MSARITEAELRETDGHTPGLWRYVPGMLLIDRGSSGRVHAVEHSVLVDRPESEVDKAAVPNARLMALAPRLLAEVRRLRALIVANGVDIDHIVHIGGTRRFLSHELQAEARSIREETGGAE